MESYSWLFTGPMIPGLWWAPGGEPVVFHNLGTETESDGGFAGRLLHVCMCCSTLARSLLALKYLNSSFLGVHDSQPLDPGLQGALEWVARRGSVATFELRQMPLKPNADGGTLIRACPTAPIRSIRATLQRKQAMHVHLGGIVYFPRNVDVRVVLTRSNAYQGVLREPLSWGHRARYTCL